MNYVDKLNFFGVEAMQSPCIKGEGAPTTSTEAAVGFFYMDTLSGDVYKCVAVNGNAYTWEPFNQSSGGNIDQLEPVEDDIPKVFFGAALPQTKDDTIMSFRYISKTKDISGYCKTKAQGNSSMSNPKKNQTVKLYKDAECSEKLKVDFKGWGDQNKFCFKANWIDLTHARNIVSARLWGDVVKTRSNYAELPELLRTSPNQGAVDGFPVKVYANGVYQGRYTLNIPKDGWMANMDDENEAHCILCGENYGSGCFREDAKIDGSDWSDELHDTVPESIKTRWNEVISFVMNSTDEEFAANIGNYFDVNSLIDYYIAGLVICNNDGFGKNQLFFTYDGEKWYASAYDMDNTFGTYLGYIEPHDFPRNNYEDFKNGGGNLLYIRMENLFADAIKARYAELKNGALSIENIVNRFERFTDICPPYLVEEDYADTTAGGGFTEIPLKAESNIQQIRGYIVERYPYVDSYIENLGSNGNLLYSLYDTTFAADVSDTITTDVKLFDEPKDFTIFIDLTSAEDVAKHACILDASNSGDNNDGGFAFRTFAYDTNGYDTRGVPGNGASSTFYSNLGNIGYARLKVAFTFKDGLPVSGASSNNISVKTFSKNPSATIVPQHEAPLAIGSQLNGGNQWSGTIHALEIYDYIMNDAEIAAKLA